MSKIRINDLNEEITLSEDEIKHVNGGTGYIKIPDIAGESQLTLNTSGQVATRSTGGKPIDYFSTPKWKI